MAEEELRGSARYTVVDAHIGQGAYGKVEKARDRVTGELVAIKKVKVEHKLRDDIWDDNRAAVMVSGINHSVYREIKIMRELNHPNLISLYDVYLEGDFINLVMPLMDSDLRKLLDKRVRLTESQSKCIVQQILLGLEELHRNFFLHRDLSPGNVFIDAEGVCKVADFGLSRPFGSPRPSKKTWMTVTLWYRPPELLYGAQYYQDRADMWAVGCIMGELFLGGRPLFNGNGEVEQLAKIVAVRGSPSVAEREGERLVRGNDLWPAAASLPCFFEFAHTPPTPLSDIFPLVPSSALDLMDKLLQLDPLQRISAADALKHPWFKTAPRPCMPRELPRV